MRTASGFTIIELIAVIVILGILAAVALPRYLDLSASARTASCQSWRGSIESASALNFAGRIATPAVAGSVALTTCTGLGTIVSGGFPANLSVGGTFTSTTNGATNACTIEYSAGGATCNATVNVIAVN